MTVDEAAKLSGVTDGMGLIKESMKSKTLADLNLSEEHLTAMKIMKNIEKLCDSDVNKMRNMMLCTGLSRNDDEVVEVMGQYIMIRATGLFDTLDETISPNPPKTSEDGKEAS